MGRDFDNDYHVSVIIPHYNSLDLLWVAIESIASQTVVPSEIIVIDDASGSHFELPGRCGDDIALRLIRETENRGAAWCRNRGIEEATGDLIAFLDADDRWLPTKLERCIAAFGPKPAGNEAKVLFSNVMLTDGSRRILGNRFPYDGQSMLDFILLEGGYIQTSSIMMWRHQYPLISFDGSLRRHQDWDFAIKAEMAGCTFVYLHDALVEYSLSAGATRISGSPNCEPSLVFFEKYNKLMSKGHVSSFIFNVLIYKNLDISLRLGIVERIIFREVDIPNKGWVSLFARLVIGRGGVNLMKQLRRKIQIRDYST
ncbi:glycosyltransferase family 2 protein [Paraburkholderia lycopersici]|uniref:Glycosyl transferase family 2 n=1 Tax=Paraburkholderia lycopersici TaxID=416944 RepID=A0A1G6GJI8_9BURK|nr:glycosyltransferase family 2 protein [Paraburkholderia lycopersici]SDB82167.1 Glycosyl transferase family 2 [Paraburkholderia lycopersici]